MRYAVLALCLLALFTPPITLAAPEEANQKESEALSEEAPLPFVQGSFTIALLPDTQGYAEYFPDLFEAQTAWIAEEAEARNIVYVLHLGDIVDDNKPEQWAVAQRSMQRLDGVVPYAMAPGNHDYGKDGTTDTRQTFFNEYFPLSAYADWPTLGGVFEGDRLDNSCHFFSAGGRDCMVLALEFAPRDGVLDWANGMILAHPDRWVILITHAYLYSDDTRYDWASKGKKQLWNPHAYGVSKSFGHCNDGEEIWRKVLSRHPKCLFAINGHVLHDGLAYRSDPGEAGNTVHQMLVNFQMKHHAGDGYLRLLEFLPDGETVQVKDYSPVTKRYKTSPENCFTLKIPKP